MLRVLRTRASADGQWALTGATVQELTSQFPLAAPSVFNFYQPDYGPPGPVAEVGLVAPEFQITNDSTSGGARRT
jgi:hypothetical protein